MIADFSSHEAQALYIVGGFVRDLILNLPSVDFDVVVEGDAVAFGRALAKKFGGRVVSHRQFGTAKWQIREIRSSLHELLGFKQADPVNLPDSLDLISARTEFYDRPTALPTVERSSIKLDLHRRDFTINTLALRLDGSHYGELYDYWGGMADLENKIVRVLHSLSFVDDPTRLLRAVRFEQRFGFKIEERTLQLMLEARELLDQVSGERLRHEFELIMREQEPPKIFHRLDELGLLAQIHPDLTWTYSQSHALTQVFDFTQKSDWKIPAQVGNTPTSLALGFLVLVSGMDPGGAEKVGNRLKLPRQVLNDILQILKFRSRLESLTGKTPGQITPDLETLPIFGVYALYCLETNENRKTMLEKFATTWRFIKPGVDGYTLKKLGIPPGPRYAEILSRIRTSWLEGTISTAQEEEDFLKELLEH
jgi:tRNA nucleotidyltransferase (CCA-adding enzyme)